MQTKRQNLTKSARVVTTICAFLATSACGHTQTQIMTRSVPVPVPCKVAVTRPAMPLDVPYLGLPLEGQNALLRGQVATQAGYIVDLEAAVTGCGGAIRRTSP